MALKHFVERRKEEMCHKGIDTVLSRLYFAIENLELTVRNFYTCEYFYPNKYIYSRRCEEDFSLRVVTEIKKDVLEIKSIHYRLYKKIQPED